MPLFLSFCRLKLERDDYCYSGMYMWGRVLIGWRVPMVGVAMLLTRGGYSHMLLTGVVEQCYFSNGRGWSYPYVVDRGWNNAAILN